MKKTVLYAAAFALVMGLGFSVNAMAGDKGPAEMTLQATVDAAAKPKPAMFPHAKHQETLACGECHHGKDAAGKQVAYVEGQKNEKCESCHNKAAGMDKKIATFKDAAHTRCKGCHTEKKVSTKCDTCHKK
ncbi:MAG: cytochrome c family protein [Proteobacteria bacterium]|nr:cytochrome c family protein [Pseudomonadota bacterium]MBU1648790.1 cytochrome c family protein [Pseudomonadota bacterium]